MLMRQSAALRPVGRWASKTAKGEVFVPKTVKAGVGRPDPRLPPFKAALLRVRPFVLEPTWAGEPALESFVVVDTSAYSRHIVLYASFVYSDTVDLDLLVEKLAPGKRFKASSVRGRDPHAMSYCDKGFSVVLQKRTRLHTSDSAALWVNKGPTFTTADQLCSAFPAIMRPVRDA